MSSKKNVAIIGAGLTGITIANLIKKRINFTIFEKSRGLGGRMATRRAEPYQFNHGAQYFKVENKGFKDFLNPLIKNKIIKNLELNHVEILNKEIIKKFKINSKKYFTAQSKMNDVVKSLAKNNFSIKLSCKIVQIKKLNNKWFIFDSDIVSYGPYDWLFLTIPPNQVIDILNKDFKFIDIIKKIKMNSCYSIMLGFDETKKLNFDTALCLDQDIRWLSLNKEYQDNKEYFNLIINSSYNFAEQNINNSKIEISDYLIKQASDVLCCKLDNYKYKAIHFWKYAMSQKSNNLGSLLDENLKIIVCGDWCMNGRVEGAFLSARDSVSKILKYI